MFKPPIDYERFASTYVVHREASQAVVEHLVNRWSDCGVSTVLEIGCGTGNHLAAIVDRLGAHGFGFDKSVAMLQACSDKYPHVSVSPSDAEERFPFEDDTFDCCQSVDFIHYVHDLRHVFSEAHRVTKRGGTIVTVTDSAEDIRQRTYLQYFPECVNKELARYPTIDQISKSMSESGWRHGEVTPAIPALTGFDVGNEFAGSSTAVEAKNPCKEGKIR